MIAGMAELVDAQVLGTCAARRGGSSPSTRTIFSKPYWSPSCNPLMVASPLPGALQMNNEIPWLTWIQRIVIGGLIGGTALYYFVGSDHILREWLPIGAAIITGSYFALLFFINVSEMIRFRREGFFSFSSAINLGVSLFCGGVLIVNSVNYFANFEFPKDIWFDVKLMLDWATKGALFDFLEAFDMELSSYEPDDNKLLFDSIEFLFRSIWGMWTAYALSTIFLRARSMIWRRILSKRRRTQID